MPFTNFYDFCAIKILNKSRLLSTLCKNQTKTDKCARSLEYMYICVCAALASFSRARNYRFCRYGTYAGKLSAFAKKGIDTLDL